MSTVTNVMITGLDSADKVADWVNQWLKGHGHKKLKEISKHATRDFIFASQLWAGAFDGLDINAFVARYKEGLGKTKRGAESVQLLMKREDDLVFHHIDNLVPKSFHYRDATQDVEIQTPVEIQPPEPPRPSSERGWKPGGVSTGGYHPGGVPMGGNSPDDS